MISTIFLEASAWYIDHIWEILLALMAFLKVIGNLIGCLARRVKS